LNGKDLLDKMSDVDPKLIADAEKKPRKKSGLMIGLTSSMAALAAAALIAVTLGNNVSQKPPVIDTSDPNSVPVTSSDTVSSGNTSTLPKITVGDYGVRGWGGREFIGAKDGVKVEKDYFNYSQLEECSPWKGAELETMPVYMSHSTDLDVDLDKMYALARKAAAALGIPEDSLEFTDNYQRMDETIEANRKMAKDAGATDEEADEMINRIIRSVMSQTYVEAIGGGVRISVYTSLKIYIAPDESAKLPDKYNFTKSATDEEIAALVDYFADKYKGIMNYSKPTLGRIDAEGIYIYDSDCDLTQQIVNYWINSAFFGEDSENIGELGRMWFDTVDGCEKLGDYPILTPEQATEILKSNKFDDEMRMPADAKILKTDIVYENSAGYTGIIPYYEFYVETDKDDSNADVACLIYTIPAVPEEFIDIDTVDYGAKE